MEDLLDNSVLLIGLIMLAYVTYKRIFHINRNLIEPEGLAQAYFLLKRNHKSDVFLK